MQSTLFIWWCVANAYTQNGYAWCESGNHTFWFGIHTFILTVYIPVGNIDMYR